MRVRVLVLSWPHGREGVECWCVPVMGGRQQGEGRDVWCVVLRRKRKLEKNKKFLCGGRRRLWVCVPVCKSRCCLSGFLGFCGPGHGSSPDWLKAIVRLVEDARTRVGCGWSK